MNHLFFLMCYQIVGCLAVDLDLRFHPYPFQPCVEVFLGEEAQLAARLVVRDCAAHHHLVEIAWLQSEVTGCFRGGHQITFTFHIRSFLLLLVLS